MLKFLSFMFNSICWGIGAAFSAFPENNDERELRNYGLIALVIFTVFLGIFRFIVFKQFNADCEMKYGKTNNYAFWLSTVCATIPTLIYYIIAYFIIY